MNTGGIIYPGLIDLHNHLSYDVFPRWHPAHLYSDRYEWRTDPDQKTRVGSPYSYLTDHDLFCNMNTYGELRALAGGATSVLATANAGCIRGLVRNLDYASGFYGPLEPDSTHILNGIEARPSTDPVELEQARSFLAARRSEMYIVHLAEGVDQISLDEFYFLQEQGLLTDKTAIIHGVALGPAEFQAMGAAGAALVWSPRSNIELYGATADVPAALDAGVQVALAPDWSVTGSSNLLDELSYASRWNADHFAGRLSDEQLVSMVTSIPAQIAGIDDQVGAIRPGLYADLLVISGDRDHPYRALIEARPADVQLVMIGGRSIYGAPDFMEAIWSAAGLSRVIVDGNPKLIRMPAQDFEELASELQAAMASQNTELAPLTETR
jgi:cytosine/adenosine deaminase-related metal-dependent hydrolase